MPNDFFISLIRTWIPIILGTALTWLAVHFGVVLDGDTSAALAVAAVGAVTAVYYLLARWVETRWPGLGRILLALGLTKTQPKYTPVRSVRRYRHFG